MVRPRRGRATPFVRALHGRRRLPVSSAPCMSPGPPLPLSQGCAALLAWRGGRAPSCWAPVRTTPSRQPRPRTVPLVRTRRTGSPPAINAVPGRRPSPIRPPLLRYRHPLHVQGHRPGPVGDHPLRLQRPAASKFTDGRALLRTQGDKFGKILGLGDEAYYASRPQGEHGHTRWWRDGTGQQVLVPGATGPDRVGDLGDRGAVERGLGDQLLTAPAAEPNTNTEHG